jgi:hypothetical protein
MLLSILSLIFAVIGLLIFAAPFGVAAIVCGIIGLKKTADCENKAVCYALSAVGIGIGAFDLIVGIINIAMSTLLMM